MDFNPIYYLDIAYIKMNNIQYIHNVTAANGFVAPLNSGVFTTALDSIPSINPDEVIIRAINFNGLAADNNMYLIWCNLTNGYIGSFCGGSLAPHFPQTHIKLNAPVPNVLEFKLFTFYSGILSFVTSVTGDLAINMDFIKYRNTPSSA